MTKNHVLTVLRSKAQYAENMNAGQLAALQGQLTKALHSSNLGVRMAAQQLIKEFSIHHPEYSYNSK